MKNIALNAKDQKYPNDTAGRLMIANVPLVLSSATIKEAKEQVLKNIKNFETINYIYVINQEKKLRGVLSIKDVLGEDGKISVRKIMQSAVASVHPHTDQERVAYMALKYNIKSVPVIDKRQKFLGIVPSDVILGIMHSEASEDLLRMAGVSGHKKMITDNILELPIIYSLKRRLPWLLIGLAGGILSARIIGLFANTLEQNIILAAFIPLIVYMGGAVEAQMVTFYIRDTALNPKLPFKKYFVRQFGVVLLLALIASSLLYFIGFAFYRDAAIAQVVGVALFAAISSSVIAGLITPYFFSRFKFDPANASGPVATIIQDLLSVTLYFAIASIIL